VVGGKFFQERAKEKQTCAPRVLQHADEIKHKLICRFAFGRRRGSPPRAWSQRQANEDQAARCEGLYIGLLRNPSRPVLVAASRAFSPNVFPPSCRSEITKTFKKRKKV